MTYAIEEDNILHEVDDKLIILTKQVNVIKYLMPTNLITEREKFLQMKGKYDPQFTYNFPDEAKVLGWIDDLEQMKKAYVDEKEYSHPMGKLLSEKIDENILSAQLLLAYVQQDFSAIAKYNKLIYGDFNPELVKKYQTMKHSYQEPNPEMRGKMLNADEIQQYILTYIQDNNLADIELCPVDHNPAKFSLFLSEKKCRLVFSHNIQLREYELMASLEHELGVHYRRYLAGKKSGWKLLTYGTAHYIGDEEGLAVFQVREEKRKHFPLYEKLDIYEKYFLLATSDGKSFSEIADFIQAEGLASSLSYIFTMVVRIKQGIQDTSVKQVGTIFTLNKLYAEGIEKVQDRIAKGNDISLLYSGKIKIEDLPYLA